jgi:succinate dehydrogenase/fumarate reductase cytochrome b subunit
MERMTTTESERTGLRTDSLTSVVWVGIAVAVVSGLIHLFLGVRQVPSGLGISFVLAGLGFLGAVALVLVGYRRSTVYLVGVPFVLVQIVLWYYVNFVGESASFPGDVGTLGAVDKIAQVVLLVVLVRLLQ